MPCALEEQHHVVVKRLLVAFERDHVVGLGIDDLLRHVRVAARRIERDDTSVQVE